MIYAISIIMAALGATIGGRIFIILSVSILTMAITGYVILHTFQAIGGFFHSFIDNEGLAILIGVFLTGSTILSLATVILLQINKLFQDYIEPIHRILNGSIGFLTGGIAGLAIYLATAENETVSFLIIAASIILIFIIASVKTTKRLKPAPKKQKGDEELDGRPTGPIPPRQFIPPGL